MKKSLLLLLLVLPLMVFAQPFNNEWIEPGRTYYKFKLAKTGLYRVYGSLLAANGLGAAPADRLQLWRNGKEIPIYTSVTGAALGVNDYIEFWGEMNDGKPDNELYNQPDFQLNDKWSLESDSAAFYLTVNAGTNRRLVEQPNTIPPGAIPADYFMHKEGIYLREQMVQGFGYVNVDVLYGSEYDIGEGWASQNIAGGQERTFNVPALQAFTGAGAPNLNLQANLFGNANNPRDLSVRLNGTAIATQAMNYFTPARIAVSQPATTLAGNQAAIAIKNESTNPNDRMVVAKLELEYPRKFNFGGSSRFEFNLPANAAGTYLEISGFDFGATNPVLYDLANGERYIANITAAPLVKLYLPASAADRKLVLVSQATANISTVLQLERRDFTDFTQVANQGDFLVISHPSLRNSATPGDNPLENYRQYRSSPAGGNHTVRIIMIGELEDQFGFGIAHNPAGIRNFLRWARVHFNEKPAFVMLIGKGTNYVSYKLAQNAGLAELERLQLVPTFGNPASDNLLAADIGKFTPQTPIGRLSVVSGQEINDYLAKVRQYELLQATPSPLIADKAWNKNIVHLIGASDGATGDDLQRAMERFRQLIVDTLYGANVATFSKVSSVPVEPGSIDRLQQIVAAGTSLITYFGHSSSSSLEFGLNDPEFLNFNQKYPVMITLGCNAGNMFGANPLRLLSKETISERFVLTPNTGSVAFVASSYFGMLNVLDLINTNTYEAIRNTRYGKTLGEIMMETYRKTLELTTTADITARWHCEQSTIHGDPALHLDVFAPKPDYVIEDQNVLVSPGFISVADNTFNLKVKVLNLARAPDKPVVLEIRRSYPDLTTALISRVSLPGIRYADSVELNIPIIPTRDKGLNKITVCIDPDNQFAELYETNNCVTKEIFIYENEARPVYPANYAIIKRQLSKLVASTANPFASEQTYYLEMDTTERFNSPLKISRTVRAAGGIVEFSPGITFADNTVYYWRVAPEALTGSPVWNNASFLYLDPGTSGSAEEGYNQSHYFQHTRSGLRNLLYEAPDRKWYFTKQSQSMVVNIGTWTRNGCTDQACLNVTLNGVVNIRLVCWFSSLVFNVIDPVSFKPWLNQTVVPHSFPTSLGEGLYGSTDSNCQPDEPRYHNFEYRYTDESSRRKMMLFMRDVVPDGYYVVVRNATLPLSFNFPNAWPAEWRADTTLWGHDESLYHYLLNAGFTGINQFTSVKQWALVYKKNDPSFTPRWVMTNDDFERKSLPITIFTPDTVGYVQSPVFGPARAWKSLHWRGTGDPSGDIATVDLIGIRADGTEQVLYHDLTTAQQDLDISTVSAVEFPNVRLQLRTEDRQQVSPYQLKYWQLYYEPSPEGAIAPALHFQGPATAEAGEPVNFRVALKNISPLPFDSVKVKMVVTDKNNLPHIIPLPKRRPLLTAADAPLDTLHVGGTISTGTLQGNNTVFIEANPFNDQPEQYHFNNFIYRTLYVKPDSLSPLLDITFDGVHILNQDIVAAQPRINIRLKDEARWMRLDDTSLLKLKIRYPDGSIRPYWFSNTDTVKFIPAGNAPVSNNTAEVEMRPWFRNDGMYELIVTARDKTGNKAGDLEYRVLFEVITKPMISNLVNYPNPFTSSTAFVFTITGNEVPQNIKIEIMTVTGKIVREITKEELGPLHVGRNITDFKWNGTDQFGQPLGNGVYLYRVVTNLNGKTMDKYSTTANNTDKYFTRGYGKMYLMR